MLDVSRNQHRWRKSLDEQTCGVLDDAAARLAWAWKVDVKYPKSYPANTSYAFDEITNWIREAQRHGLKNEGTKLRLLRSRPPRRFSDLVDDRTLRAVYEDQNTGSYLDALKCARSGDKSAPYIFRKILKAAEWAYFIGHFGDDFAPRPRVNFLHRNLLKIAELLQLTDLTHKGLVEFLDDLCPCGHGHRLDAVRKLRKRFMRRRPSTD